MIALLVYYSVAETGLHGEDAANVSKGPFLV